MAIDELKKANNPLTKSAIQNPPEPGPVSLDGSRAADVLKPIAPLRQFEKRTIQPNVVTSKKDQPEPNIESVDIKFLEDGELVKLTYDSVKDPNHLAPKKTSIKTDSFYRMYDNKPYTFQRGKVTAVPLGVARHIMGEKHTDYVLGLAVYKEVELTDELARLRSLSPRWQHPLPLKIVGFKERTQITEILPEGTVKVT